MSLIAVTPIRAAVRIRSVCESDLPALEWDGEYTHYREVYRHNFEEARRGQRILLVAQFAEALVGQVFVQLHSSEALFADGLNRAYLYALRVRAPWQGQGIGTQLIAMAEAELRQRQFRTAVIAAARDNPRALNLYQRLGFRVVGEDPGRWDFVDHLGQERSVQEPCWVLEKQIV
jgi:ribosomal protein S18 acetylase RimI-like enzyme